MVSVTSKSTVLSRQPDHHSLPEKSSQNDFSEAGTLSRASTIVTRNSTTNSEKSQSSTPTHPLSLFRTRFHQAQTPYHAGSDNSIRYRGILAMLVGISAQMLCWGLIMTYGTILAFYTQYLIPNTAIPLITLAGAIPPFCLLSLALPWGRLLDAGHHRTLNIVAGICLTGGLLGLAFTGTDQYGSGQYWAIILASVPMGIGQSIYFLAAPQMAKTWHPKNKGLAMGVTNSGAALGGVAWPLVFSSLVDHAGFRAGVLCLTGIAAGLSIFIAIFGCPAPSFQRHKIGNRPCDLRVWWPTQAFKSRVFLLHTAAMCCVYLGILTIPFFIELWARRSGDIGVSEDTDAGFGVDVHPTDKKPVEVYLVATMNACQLPGRLFGSSLCDKIRARKIHTVACAVSVAVIGSFWFVVASFQAGMVFAALFGSTLGVMVSLPINDAQDLLGHHRTHLLGQYAGAVYTCASPFILGGAVASGALVQRFDVFVAPAVWCMICFTAGGLLILASLLVKDDTEKLDDPVLTSARSHSDGDRSEAGSSDTAPKRRPLSVASTMSGSQSTACGGGCIAEVDEKRHIAIDEEQGSRICNTINEEDEECVETGQYEQDIGKLVRSEMDRKWSWYCPEAPK